jgi:hypothetical protein
MLPLPLSKACSCIVLLTLLSLLSSSLLCFPLLASPRCVYVCGCNLTVLSCDKMPDGLNGAVLQWLAEIWDDKTEEYLPIGTYKDEKDAARAYDRACLREHGGNANTNFPAAQYEEADAREVEKLWYRARETLSDWDMDPEEGDAAEGTALVLS